MHQHVGMVRRCGTTHLEFGMDGPQLLRVFDRLEVRDLAPSALDVVPESLVGNHKPIPGRFHAVLELGQPRFSASQHGFHGWCNMARVNCLPKWKSCPGPRQQGVRCRCGGRKSPARCLHDDGKVSERKPPRRLQRRRPPSKSKRPHNRRVFAVGCYGRINPMGDSASPNKVGEPCSI